MTLAEAIYHYVAELDRDSTPDALIRKSQVSLELRHLVRENGDTEPPPARDTTPAPPGEELT